MITSIDYQSLHDFTGLPAVRRSCGTGERGLRVVNIPSLSPKDLEKLRNERQGFEVPKSDTSGLSNAAASAVGAIMESLHNVSEEVFKNRSHAFELPWEKYLGEMHEYSAPSKDRLRLVKAGDPIPNEWSTLTIAINTSSPETAFVLYGAALSVFSEGTTPIPTESHITSYLITEGLISKSGDWIIYYICPNHDVFYTRGAGALMTPLSSDEYESRKRVNAVVTAP